MILLGGHPCPDYASFSHSVRKTRDENYKVALSKLVSGKKQKKSRKRPKYEQEIIIPEIPKQKKHKKRKNKPIAVDENFAKELVDLRREEPKKSKAVFVLIFLAVVVILFFYFHNIKEAVVIVANESIVLPNISTSFDYIFDDKVRYNNKMVKLDGFLGNQTKTDVTIYFIFDSFKNRVYLRSISDSLINTLKNHSSNKFYSVEGRMRLADFNSALYYLFFTLLSSYET